MLTIWKKLSWSSCVWCLLSELLLNERNTYFIMMRSFLCLLVFQASYFFKTKVFEREHKDNDLLKRTKGVFLCVYVSKYFIKSFSGCSKSKVSVPLIIFILKTEPYISPSSAVPEGSQANLNNINFSL